MENKKTENQNESAIPVQEKPNYRFGMKRLGRKRIRTSNQTNLRSLDDEEWKKIDFLDNRYAISSYGRVRSYCKDVNGIPMKPVEFNGFLSISIRIAAKSKKFMIHKLVAYCFLPKKNDDQSVVTHLDWNPLNNHYSNLQWLTKKESITRMFKYLSLKSQKRPKKIQIVNAKINEDDVRKLKKMLEGGVRQNIIAKLFNISEMQVTRIKRGENWGHIAIEEK